MGHNAPGSSPKLLARAAREGRAVLTGEPQVPSPDAALRDEPEVIKKVFALGAQSYAEHGQICFKNSIAKRRFTYRAIFDQLAPVESRYLLPPMMKRPQAAFAFYLLFLSVRWALETAMSE
jgi:hypothetical protein